MTPENDHYAILDLPRSASAAEIKRRYRQLMREAHPDANRGDLTAATRRAARLNLAFETLGDETRRRAYDAQLPAAPRRAARRDPKRDPIYAHWAEQEDWEDIVAANVPPPRLAHVHQEEPLIEPDEIEVDMAELRMNSRVKRSIRVTNRCECVMKGDVSTSEPWLWGPIGHFELQPGAHVDFEVEVVGRKVTFPGLSRVSVVTNTWTGVVPVAITGFEMKNRRVLPSTESAYVPSRGRTRKWARRR